MDFEGLQQLASKEIKTLEGEILTKKHAGVSTEELNEFKECFDHFDRNKGGYLERLELLSCLKSLGQDPTEAELDNVLNQYGTASGTNEDGSAKKVLAFEPFVNYMKSKHSQGNSSPAAIKDNFRIMANGKDIITEAEIRAVLPPEKANFLISQMPKVSGGYDYNAYTDSLFK
eukprot:TRINITY_DN5218_c0_g2_i3.p1 TRINITY_DN5218_c0_g2~~TRINITY_DN5218_c0_g2_i3.p1  ORF type:complete len:173 (-),score=49.85 TRINITY_DN5218_c0_g2_i3:74-592(-)